MIKDIFALWQTQSDLIKLQYAYGVVVIVTLVAAGLVGLLNQTAAWQILSVTWIAAVALSVNLISFALVNLLPKPEQTKRTRRTPTRKSR